LDLKSVTRDVREEAMPFLSPIHPNVASDEGISSPETEQIQPLLTAPVAQQTSALATQETDMADENDTIVDTNTPATVVAALDAPTKQRKPRTKKAALNWGHRRLLRNQRTLHAQQLPRLTSRGEAVNLKQTQVRMRPRAYR